MKYIFLLTDTNFANTKNLRRKNRRTSVISFYRGISREHWVSVVRGQLAKLQQPDSRDSLFIGPYQFSRGDVRVGRLNRVNFSTKLLCRLVSLSPV